MIHDLKPDISVPVDCTNPGQFFACCGLLELADKIWAGAEGWFEVDDREFRFQIAAGPAASLEQLLNVANHMQFDLGQVGKETDEEDGRVDPIIVTLANGSGRSATLLLDWWSEKSIKPWAGSMKERRILNTMLRAIDPATDPLNDHKVAYDPGTKKKCEPFYFDCRRSSTAHPLDSGFSADAQGLESECFPAVEALCFIGLQRARPAPTGSPNESRYLVWTKPLPIGVLGPVVCGLAEFPRSIGFTFENFYRTDQRKHKCFSRARCERSRNV